MASSGWGGPYIDRGMSREARAIFHPDAKVQAGPWTSTVISLSRSGWKFEVSTLDFNREIRVGAYNPVSQRVGMFSITAHLFRHISEDMGRMVLYFPEDITLTSEHGIFSEMSIPDYYTSDTFIAAEVGMPDMTRGNETYRVYSPYKEDKSQEIIVTPDKIPMLLEEIRKAQEPRARELLHKHHRQDEALQKLEQKATILTFARA